MLTAGRNTMMTAAQKSDNPPWDWSYETAMSARNSIASSLTPISAAPSVVSTYETGGLYGEHQSKVLTEFPGCLGWTAKKTSSSTSTTYWIMNPAKGTMTETDANIPLSGNDRIRMTMTIDGKMLVENQYGFLYRFNQDGTDFAEVGRTISSSHDTNDGFELYANYDGTFTSLDAAGTAYSLSSGFSVTGTTSLSHRYASRWMKFPGKTVIASVDGYVSIRSEDLSTVYLSHSSVGSYVSCQGNFLAANGVENLVFLGFQMRKTTTPVAYGIDLSTNSIVTLNDASLGADNQHGACVLPTGQGLYYRTMRTDDLYPGQSWWGLFDPVSETHTRIITQSMISNMMNLKILSTGMLCAPYQTDSNGQHTLGVTMFDLVFGKRIARNSLITGPFGYNRAN